MNVRSRSAGAVIAVGREDTPDDGITWTIEIVQPHHGPYEAATLRYTGSRVQLMDRLDAIALPASAVLDLEARGFAETGFDVVVTGVTFPEDRPVETDLFTVTDEGLHLPPPEGFEL